MLAALPAQAVRDCPSGVAVERWGVERSTEAGKLKAAVKSWLHDGAGRADAGAGVRPERVIPAAKSSGYTWSSAAVTRIKPAEQDGLQSFVGKAEGGGIEALILRSLSKAELSHRQTHFVDHLLKASLIGEGDVLVLRLAICAVAGILTLFGQAVVVQLVKQLAGVAQGEAGLVRLGVVAAQQHIVDIGEVRRGTLEELHHSRHGN